MLSTPSAIHPEVRDRIFKGSEALIPTPGPAVSWGAIFAGAAAAAALSLILLMLGTGLGLSSLSPWAGRGASAGALGIAAIVWVTITQLMAGGMGGYLAGRLRTKWIAVQTDEVFFRDTAHGFLAWAVATLVTAALLASALGALVSGSVQVSAAIAGTAPAAAAAGAAAVADTQPGSAQPNSANPALPGYLMDSLFRKDMSTSAPVPGSTAEQAPPIAEVSRIFLNSLRAGALPADDTRYVSQRVAQHTGLSQIDAEKRVTDIYRRAQAQLQQAETQLREAADKARKATIGASLWLFISLLIGAFAASLAATYGGRQRDL